MSNLNLINRVLIIFLGFFTTSLNFQHNVSTISSENTGTFTEMSTSSEESAEVDENKEIMIKKIKEMYDRYNLYRAKTSQIYKDKGWNSDEMAENEEFIKKADATNHKEARDLFNDYGLPSNSKVGEELAHRFWLIVLECSDDQDFQTRVLKKMYTAMEAKDISTTDYAYLTDRVRINRGATQIYGTQVRYNESKKTYEPYDLKDAGTVDQRRVVMGLEPMNQYIRKMNLKYEGSLKRNKPARRLNRRI